MGLSESWWDGEQGGAAAMKCEVHSGCASMVTRACSGAGTPGTRYSFEDLITFVCWLLPLHGAHQLMVVVSKQSVGCACCAVALVRSQAWAGLAWWPRWLSRTSGQGEMLRNTCSEQRALSKLNARYRKLSTHAEPGHRQLAPPVRRLTSGDDADGRYGVSAPLLAQAPYLTSGPAHKLPPLACHAPPTDWKSGTCDHGHGPFLVRGHANLYIGSLACSFCSSKFLCSNI
jgi:hypothetical protein